MKLASYKDGSRDGQLVVVSRDLGSAHYATGIATRMQQLLDDWNFISPQLEDLSQTLNHGRARHAFAFDPRRCMAPLPRAFQRVVGSAFTRHAGQVREAGRNEPAAGSDAVPWLSQSRSDGLLGPCDDIVAASEDLGIDFGAGLAVITGDIALGTAADAALDGVRLLMLVNDLSLNALIAAERATGFGFFQSRPASAFGPVAVTPDEAGAAWRGGRLHLDIDSVWNGRRMGHCHAGAAMNVHFGQLIAQAARTRRMSAGSIVGSGTASSPERSAGFSCIAEKRAAESTESGAPTTGFLRFGDTVRIEVTSADGQSLFGAIDQRVAAWNQALNEA